MIKILQASLPLLASIINSPSLKAETPSSELDKRLIIHTVKKGEELYLLAGYYLLNARDWYLIYNWNSDVIRNQNSIFHGQELMVLGNNECTAPYNIYGDTQ